jgi:hypothetical protein
MVNSGMCFLISAAISVGVKLIAANYTKNEFLFGQPALA